MSSVNLAKSCNPGNTPTAALSRRRIFLISRMKTATNGVALLTGPDVLHLTSQIICTTPDRLCATLFPPTVSSCFLLACC